MIFPTEMVDVSRAKAADVTMIILGALTSAKDPLSIAEASAGAIIATFSLIRPDLMAKSTEDDLARIVIETSQFIVKYGQEAVFRGISHLKES